MGTNLHYGVTLVAYGITVIHNVMYQKTSTKFNIQYNIHDHEQNILRFLYNFNFKNRNTYVVQNGYEPIL